MFTLLSGVYQYDSFVHTYDLEPLAGFSLDPRIPNKGIEVQKRRVVKLYNLCKPVIHAQCIESTITYLKRDCVRHGCWKRTDNVDAEKKTALYIEPRLISGPADGGLSYGEFKR